MMFLRKLALALLLLAPAMSMTAQQPATPAAGPGQFGEESDYIVGPGDTIQIFVWEEPEMSITVPVRPDGKISSPGVDELVAVGRTPVQLARAVEKVLSEYIINPRVSIIVTNPLSTFSKITVIGAVNNQQGVPYHQGMTVLDVVLAVGGLSEFAKGNGAKILRKDANGKELEIRVKLEDLVKKGRIKENVPMKPGDVLMVPESFF